MEQSWANNKKNSKKNADELTGAFCRDSLEQVIECEIFKAHHYETSFSLCLIDIDYFKSINDAYGHIRGDQILTSFVEYLNKVIKKSDMIFRFGGDEFVIIMKDTVKEQALISANKVVQIINSTVFHGEPNLNISISCGVVNYPQDAFTVEGILEIADKCLYHAKMNGRGQVSSEYSLTKNHLVKELQFDKLSRLIEREGELEKLKTFLQLLQYDRRGIMKVTGSPGSGRTAFLNKAASFAKMYNFSVISVKTTSQKKTKPYGIFDKFYDIKSGIEKNGIRYFKEYLVKSHELNKNYGYIIILDNISNVDHGSMYLLSNILKSNMDFVFAVIYSDIPDDFCSLDYLDSITISKIDLNPLSLMGVRVWIRNILLWEPPDLFVEWLYRQSMGLPKVLDEGLSYLFDKGILIQGENNEFIVKEDFSKVAFGNNNTKSDIKPKNNLPYSLTEFIGREIEINDLCNMLGGVRLITLLGPGGIGKTRLALQVASMCLNEFKDGVFFVSLASITQPEGVVSSIAKELNISETSEKYILNSLKSALSEKKYLLVLDNFEQVLESALIVSDILTSAPNLTIIVTSREALNISGEHVYHVPPLEVPRHDQKVPIEKMEKQPAVALFLSRVRAKKYDFELTSENVPLISEILGHLDGIPLAIELAAANIDQISINEMLMQSRGRMNWLNNGPRDLPIRHQTLRNTMEWSYSLLSECLKKLFRRFGVFRGSFDIKAANAVVNKLDDLGVDLVDGMFALVNKSLLLKVPTLTSDGEKYFKMLETIGEYAEDLLADSEEENNMRLFHSDYYLSFVTEVENSIIGPNCEIWLNRLESAHSNVISALEYIQTTNSPEKELKLAAALGHFWEMRGYWNLGISRLTSIIDKYKGKENNIFYIRVHQWCGRLIYLQGDNKYAETILNEGLRLASEIDDYKGQAAILYNLGWVKKEQEELWQQSLSLYRKLCDKPGIAAALQSLSLIYFYEGKYDLSETYSNESLALCRELEDKIGIAKALGRLGLAARGNGNYEQAMKMLNEYLVYCEKLELKEEIGIALIYIAELLRSQEEYKLAQHYYNKCLKLSTELGYKLLMVRSLKDLGEIARIQKDYEKASELFNRCLEILEEIDDKGHMMWVYRSMAELQMQQENYSLAKDLYRKALQLYVESKQNTILYVFLVLGGLAAVATTDEETTRAARLFGAADKLFEIVKKSVAKDDVSEYEKRLNNLKTRMNNIAFDKAWSEGRVMGLSRVMDYAAGLKDDEIDSKMASRIADYISENYIHDISLDDISEYFNLSPSYMSKIFKYYTGDNFKDYLDLYRIKKAKDFLENSSLKINEVAKLVGYVSINTFIRVFKKYEGVSPRQYSQTGNN